MTTVSIMVNWRVLEMRSREVLLTANSSHSKNAIYDIGNYNAVNQEFLKQ